jgi:hypothetical protein
MNNSLKGCLCLYFDQFKGVLQYIFLLFKVGELMAVKDIYVLKILTGLLVVTFWVDGVAQVPARFNQQAVVRDSTGQVVANRLLRLRLSLEQTVGGTAVLRYREVHQVTTNYNGLYSVEVGGGTIELGSIDSVRWEYGSVYLKTEVDPSGGQNFMLSSNRELLSVPYAFHAKTAEVPGLPGPQGPAGSFPTGTQPGEINYWNGNAWVTLAPGNMGSVLTMCGGVPVWGPCPNQPILPTVSTTPVTLLWGNLATTGGIVSSDGGSLVNFRGVVYDTTPNPSLSSGYTVDGSGIGSFVSTIYNLSPAATYYTRAYATNSVGTSYGSIVSFTNNPTPPSIAVGQNHAGGIVFYVDSTGNHGLVCAPMDQGFSSWGLNNINVVGTLTRLGSGAMNTSIMVGYGLSAASLCDTLQLNGFNDWYLPSIDELNLIMLNIGHIAGFPGTASAASYWSSSQYDINRAWEYFLWFSSVLIREKSHTARIRAIRAF